jgi:hypothetical protein
MIGSVLGGVVKNVEEETNSNSKLVETDDGATDPLRRALGLVHWNQSGDQTDTKIRKDITDEERDGGCCRPEGHTNGEDEARSNEISLTTRNINEGSSIYLSIIVSDLESPLRHSYVKKYAKASRSREKQRTSNERARTYRMRVEYG